MYGEVWTPDQSANLAALWSDATLSCADIARRIGRTKNSVIGRANRMGLKPRLDPMVWSYNGNRYRERGK